MQKTTSCIRWVFIALVVVGWSGSAFAASSLSSWTDRVAAEAVGAVGVQSVASLSASPPDAKATLAALLRSSAPKTVGAFAFADPVRKAVGGGGEVWELTATAGDVSAVVGARWLEGTWSPLYFIMTGLPTQPDVTFAEAMEVARAMVLHRGVGDLELSAVRAPLQKDQARLGTFGRREVASPWDTYWVFLADDAPLANWGHPCRYIFVAADLSAVAVRHAHTPLSVQTLAPKTADALAPAAPALDFEIVVPFTPQPEQRSRKKPLAPAKAGAIRHDGSVSNCYAVIISGGANLRNNHIRYWGDSAFIYSTLTLQYGYPKEQIFTLISDGLDPEPDRSDNTNSPFDLDGDGVADTIGPATFEAISNLFAALQATLTTNDQLFVFLTDHGSPTEGGGFGDVELNLWNEEVLRDEELRAMTEAIAAPIFFVMEQCYSGGFLDDLNQHNRVVSTAAQPNESSWAGATFPSFNQWAYHWTAAMRGSYPASAEEPWLEGDPCFADFNGDGWVSFEEAYRYAFINRFENDNPMYQSIPPELGKRSFLTMVPRDELRMGDLVFDPLPPVVAGIPTLVRITAENVYGDRIDEYTGPATLRAEADPYDPGFRVGYGRVEFPMPMNTLYMDARSQVIYPAELMGGARTLDHLQMEVVEPPSLPLNRWTIRMKHTPLTVYPDEPQWESDGWTVVYTADETIASTGWVTFVFSEIFKYDGVQSLMVDFSFYNDAYDEAGLCRVSMATGIVAIGAVTDNEAGDPLTWSGTSPYIIESQLFPNLRWGPPPFPVEVYVTPVTLPAFTNGVWEGLVAVDRAASGVRLHAADATNETWTGMTERFDSSGVPTNYVDVASTNPVSPYATWATAATTIQDAIDAATDGATILVADGVYREGGRNAPADPGGPIHLTNRVFITKDITVRSVNGPLHTVIEGAGPSGPAAVRGVYLRGNSELVGFTIRDGHVLARETIPTERNRFGGGVLMEGNAVVRDCAIVFCDGSGVAMLGGGRLIDCSINYNTGENGGGLRLVGNATAERCVILNNRAVAAELTSGFGGGAWLVSDATGEPSLRNSYLAGNRAEGPRGGGGGVMIDGGHLVNCTLVDNRAMLFGGGLFVDEADNLQQVVNCIIYHNQAPAGPNVYLGEDAADTVQFHHLCSPEVLPGIGQVLADPLLAGIRNPHLLAASPCRDAGDPAAVLAGERDIDDEERMGPFDTVDIGCDQYHADAIDGLLWPEIDMPFDVAVAGTAFELRVDGVGKASHIVWQYDDGSGMQYITNAFGIQPVFAASGHYDIVLTAYNGDGAVSVTGTVIVAAAFIHYVAPDGLHIAPFETPENAATNIQAAINVCPAGGVVMVLPGTYREGATLVVDKPVTVRGADDSEWSENIIDGQFLHRVLELDHPGAVVMDMTLRRGRAENGGAVLIRAGTLRSCSVQDSVAEQLGGGVRLLGAARMESCYVYQNRAGHIGGGLYADGDAVIEHAWIVQNEARIGGGGVWLDQNALLLNSFVTANRAYYGAGAGMYEGGTIRNGTVTFNVASRAGGGIWHGRGQTLNTIIYYNRAPEYADNLDLSGEAAIHYCLTTPGVSGVGNITNAEPLLVGRRIPEILPASPAVDAGNSDWIADGERDFHDESRQYGASVDIGCDEVIITNMIYRPWTAIVGNRAVVVDEPVTLWADGFGRMEANAWTVAGVATTATYANVSYIEPVWSEPGAYEVILTGTSVGGVHAFTVTVHVVEAGFTNYVSTNGLHIAPFTDWNTAATNLHAAIAACPAGGTTVIGPGHYALSGTVNVNKRMTLAGTAGPEVTTLDGGGLFRVMLVDDPGAFVHSLALVNGAANYAAGLELREGVVSNVLIHGNTATEHSGGFRVNGDGLLTHAMIVGNTAVSHAGGKATGRSRVRRVTFTGNHATGHGGGLGLEFVAEADDCAFIANHAGTDGGALYLMDGGIVRNSQVISNEAGRIGAGVFVRSGRIENMLITDNQSGGDVGGVYLAEGSALVGSVVAGNVAAGQIGGVLATSHDYDFLPAVVSSCTIAHNTAMSVGGIVLGPYVRLINSILYGNQQAGAELSEYVIEGTGQHVAHSRILPLRPWFVHCTFADPQLVGADDLSLQPTSPVINAGVNEDWMVGAVDVAGQPRIQNLVVDMGALESPYWSRYLDYDGDGFTDWVEVERLGTDPADPDSYLSMGTGVLDPEGGGVMVRWQSVAGKRYHVDRATDLLGEPAFEEWLSDVEGEPDMTTVYDHGHTNAPSGYYRVRLAPE